MKYFVALAVLVASSLAQRIQIGAPANLAEIQPGSNITVEVDRPVRAFSSARSPFTFSPLL